MGSKLVHQPKKTASHQGQNGYTQWPSNDHLWNGVGGAIFLYQSVLDANVTSSRPWPIKNKKKHEVSSEKKTKKKL